MKLRGRSRKRELGGRAARGGWRALAALVLGAAAPAAADTIGMIGDAGSNLVIVFNADTGVVLGQIELDEPPRDVLVMPDQSLGFVLAGGGEVFVIDLSGSRPKLAGEPPANPIATVASGSDLALSPDERYLLVAASGAPLAQASVIDVATRTVKGNFLPDSPSHVALDICRDGTVLASGPTRTASLTLDALGELTPTAESLSEPASDVVCAPDARSAVQVLAASSANSSLESFALPELVSRTQLSGADELGTPALGVPSTLVFHPSGERLFVRGTVDGTTGDMLTAFEYEPSTGEIGERVASATTREGLVAGVGLEQIAIHPDGQSLYVPVPGRLDIYDSSTLALRTSVSGLSTTAATRSVALSARSGEIRIQVDTEPLNGLGWLHPLRGSLVSVALLGSPRFHPASVDQESVRFGPKNAKPLLAGQLDDVDDDGTNDLVLLFRRKDVRIGARGVEHCAKGKLSNRTRFVGCQWLRAQED